MEHKDIGIGKLNIIVLYNGRKKYLKKENFPEKALKSATIATQICIERIFKYLFAMREDLQ